MMTICRFQTTPPLPPLKAAITTSASWTINQLISKITNTILSETELNPSTQSQLTAQRIILELPDGCRLPTTEYCSIINQEQLLTVRLYARPQSQLPLGPLNYHVHRTLFPLLLPPTNTDFHRPSDHQSTTHLPDIPPEQYPSPAHLPSPFTFTLGGHQSPSPDLSHQTNQEQQHQRSYPDPTSQRSLSSPRPSTSPTPQTHPDHASHSQQEKEIPYRSPSSSSSEEHKPTAEELEQSVRPPGSDSDHQVPRVRSHIAAFRKTAFRHYLPESSSDGSGSSSADDSEDSISFSRHTRSFTNKRASRPSHSRQVRTHSVRPPRISTRHSMGGPTKPPAATSRLKRKSAPVRPILDSDDDELIQQPGNIHKKVRKINKPNRVEDDSSSSTDLSKHPPNSSHHEAQASWSSQPRKNNHISQEVQVVIPFSPDLVSPAYLKHKRYQVEPSPNPSLRECTLPSSPAAQSMNDTSPSTSSTNNTAEKDFFGRAQKPAEWPINRHPKHTHALAKNSSPIKSYQPTQSRCLTKTKSFTPINTRCSEPNQLTLSLSAGRTARSVYQIYMHDMQFKSASAQGPQRIPCSSSGLNGASTLSQVVTRLNLDMRTSWKLIIGDKVWLSDASSLKRVQTCEGGSKKLGGLLDGRIVQIGWLTTLEELGVFPTAHNYSGSELKPLHIQVIRNWDL